MLPAIPKSLGTLSLVFASALDSLSGKSNPLNLPSARSAIVILVDGLGSRNLAARAGHAPFLSRLSAASKPILCDFPSTTATSLTGLGTGLRAAEHGIIGYSVVGQVGPSVLNMLSGWGGDVLPKQWQPNETVAERAKAEGKQVFFVGSPDYSNSGFTDIIMRGAEYVPAKSIETRFAEAARLVRTAGNLVYLYIPELDQAAHSRGWESNEWIDLLEALDSEVKTLAGDLRKGEGLLLTADHGVIDVPPSNHIYLDEFGAAVEGFEAVAGDPRVNYVYLKPGEDPSATAEAISELLPAGVVAVTGADLIEAGYFGGTSVATKARIPDVVVLAIAKWVTYDRRFCKPKSLEMIGHHGSVSREELEVPLLRFGAY
ncbi:MAG: hypothetical protein RLZZ626_146 [Actinomycetota bacterium]